MKLIIAYNIHGIPSAASNTIEECEAKLQYTWFDLPDAEWKNNYPAGRYYINEVELVPRSKKRNLSNYKAEIIERIKTVVVESAI